MLRSLADDDTILVEGPAERCQSEIVDVDVIVDGNISDEVLDVSDPC